MIVSITGHRSDAFIQSHYTDGMVKLIAEGVVATFKREYEENLIFNIGGAIGVDSWVAQTCIEQKVKYHLYLPMLSELQSKYWTEEQKEDLNIQLTKASAINIFDSSGEYKVWSYHERDKMMVDNSNILVAFWVGKRQGGTYNTIKYALKQSKFTLNALNELKPIFSEQLKKGWTPQITRENNEKI